MVDRAMSGTYRIGEFAELAGVTVRALHHYDRIGLLKPERGNSGNRLYRLQDLERLEQIAALKFLGIPLQEIKLLLKHGPLDAHRLTPCAGDRWQVRKTRWRAAGGARKSLTKKPICAIDHKLQTNLRSLYGLDQPSSN